MKRSVWQLFVCVLLFGVTAQVVEAGKSVEIRQQNGVKWRGELKQTIEITYKKRGRTISLSGVLIKSSSSYVVIKGTKPEGGIGETIVFMRDIVRVRTLSSDPVEVQDSKDDSSPDQPSASATSSVGGISKPAKKGNDAYDDKNPGVFVLPMSGMVGVEMRAHEIELLAEEADKYGPGQTLIFRLNTGGGLVTEGERFAHLMPEIKKRHRCIAWIEEAISGGCAFAVLCDEIYFMTEGAAGSITAFSGTVSLKGRELEEWIENLGNWFEEGGRSRLIAQAMIHAPLMLSYDKDPDTGEVTFYNDLSGEFILSRPGQNLTFNASNAVHCGFADGIADTEEDLAKLLDLPEWHEKSSFGRNLSKSWNSTVKQAKHDIPILLARYGRDGAGLDQAGQIGKQIQTLKKLIRWWKKCAIVCEMNGLPPVEELEKQIKELRYRLSRGR